MCSFKTDCRFIRNIFINDLLSLQNHEMDSISTCVDYAMHDGVRQECVAVLIGSRVGDPGKSIILGEK